MPLTSRITEAYQRVPDDLAERDQWVLWRRERGTKVPYRPDGRRASTTKPADWSECQAAIDALNKCPQRFAGIGFVFAAEDPFVGIDLDNCLDDQSDLRSWAQGIVERFADTYMEVSPSGRGIKIWAKGKLPTGVGKVAIEDGGIEIYDHARYFTVTGSVFRGAPFQVEDHTQDILRLCERLTGGNGIHPQGPKYPIPPDAKIPKGKQHLTLISLAGTLRRRGVCDQAIEACLQAVNRWQCSEPGPPENIARIVKSSRAWRRP